MQAKDLRVDDVIVFYNKERCKVIDIRIVGDIATIKLEYIDFPGKPHSTITSPANKSIDSL